MTIKLLSESIVIRLEGDIEHQTQTDEEQIDRAILELRQKGYHEIHPQVSKKTKYKVITLTGVKKTQEG
jgi:hypothetical protein